MEARERLGLWCSASEPVPIADVLACFDELDPLPAEAMIGAWDGSIVPTGHRGERALAGLDWAGKTFHDSEHVDPLVCFDDGGERLASDALGAARLRMVEYRGVATATMIYDDQPIIDHFRGAGDDLVLGLMDRKGEDVPLAFVLRRRQTG